MNKSTLTFDVSRRGERGVTLLMVAVSIAVLLAIAALAIDIGVLYTAKTSAQNAVDAAALAGAYTFESSPTAGQPATAVNAIKAVLKANSVLGKQMNMDAVTAVDDSGNGCASSVATPPFICVDRTNQRVTVAAGGPGATTIDVYFARILGFSSVKVGAIATAEAGKSAMGTYCLRPFYMPMATSTTGCQADFFNSDGTLNSKYVGQKVTLWDQLEPSEWGLLNLSGGNSHGKDSIVPYIEECDTSVQYSCGDTSYNVDNGARKGQIEPAVTNLITDHGAVATDTWQGVGKYVDGETGIVKNTSRSLQTVVIWDCINDPLGHGSKTMVKVSGFGTVFIDGVSKKDGIDAHLVNAAMCSTGGSGSGATGTGPHSIPVRLIQTPSGQ